MGGSDDQRGEREQVLLDLESVVCNCEGLLGEGERWSKTLSGAAPLG